MGGVVIFSALVTVERKRKHFDFDFVCFCFVFDVGLGFLVYFVSCIVSGGNKVYDTDGGSYDGWLYTWGDP